MLSSGSERKVLKLSCFWIVAVAIFQFSSQLDVFPMVIGSSYIFGLIFFVRKGIIYVNFVPEY